jgi:hypothetical protein
MTPREYLHHARELGRLERIPPPYLPLRERGSIEWQRRHREQLWPELYAQVRADVYTRLFDPVVHLLGQPGGVGPQEVAEALLGLCATHPFGVEYGVVSLRSHVEAFLYWMSPVRDMRPVFTESTARLSAVFETACGRALDGRPTVRMQTWSTTVQDSLDAIARRTQPQDWADERLAEIFPPLTREGMGPPGLADAARPGRSEFHEYVTQQMATRSPTWFGPFRFVINVTYEQLPLMGITPLQRYFVCFAIAETIDRLTGTTWRERIDRTVSMASAAPVPEAAS